MHSKSTTDLSIISSNLNDIKCDKENVVLIKTGSMNPIHRSHILNMIKTKEYLSKYYYLNIIGGYISPSHDQYVKSKLGKEYIYSQDRIQMCQNAIQEENQQHWLSVDKAESMGIISKNIGLLVFAFFLASNFIDLRRVTLSLQNFLNENIKLEKPIRVIYVAGLDLFNRCNGMYGLRQSNVGGLAVVYRYGENKSLIQSIINQNSSKLYFISLEDQNQNEISSTLIRRKLQINEDCSHLTYKSVLEHLKMNK